MRLIFGLLLLFSLLHHSTDAAAPGSFASSDEGSVYNKGSIPGGAQFVISRTLGREDTRYHVVKTIDGLSSHSESAGVKAKFTAKGPVISVGEACWMPSLIAAGYGENWKIMPATEPQAVKNRVEYRRDTITEWYVNGPLGLQQGFTITAAPPGRDNDTPLTLALAKSSDVQFAVNTDRREMRITSGYGSALAYGGLIAFDAQWQDLEAWIEVRDGQPLLRVDDRDALYPVTVDPFIQKAKLTSSEVSISDQFGYATAISGDTIVVTSPYGVNTAAWVFVKPASGGWATATETAKLVPSSYPNSSFFGFSVAIDGDTIVVGSWIDYVGGNGGQGAAYVFVKPAGGWVSATETAKLTASDGEPEDNFGSAVSISDGTIVVGAWLDDIGGNHDQGSAYVFVRPTCGWVSMTETAKLIISDGAANDLAGFSAAVSGDTVVVGSARWDHSGGAIDQGAAYVFVKPVGGWTNITETAKLTASDGAAYNYFGHSVAISGDTVVVGSPYAGSAYLFTRPAGGWATATETAKLRASDGAADDYFGTSVAISNDTVVVGARLDDVGGSANRGSAYVFEKPAGGWATTTQTAKLTASDGAVNGDFGVSVAISNNTIVVGADGQGTAYVFETPAACASPGFYTLSSINVNSQPSSVALGDYNQDGRTDLAVANSGSDNVSIRLADGNGGFSIGAQISTGRSPISVAAGNLNNDGFLDLAIANQSGSSVSILLGDGLGGFYVMPSVQVNGAPHAVVLGDVNGDGILDLATANQSNNSVSIRLGDGTGGFYGTTRVSVGASPRSVALGDFNGDGKLDLVTANQSHNTASICLGNGTGGFTLFNSVVVGLEPFSVALGDLNQDGKVDLAVANKGSNSVSIRLGNGTGGFSSALNVNVGNAPHSVTIGDLDGDGKLDLATANRSANTISIRYGNGSGGFFGSTEVNVGIQPYFIASGDINGDGRLDLAVPNLLSFTVSILLHTCF